jgi:hypothetical protein
MPLRFRPHTTPIQQHAGNLADDAEEQQVDLPVQPVPGIAVDMICRLTYPDRRIAEDFVVHETLGLP